MNTCTCNPEICKCDIGCCPCQDKVAEPKPTPSTPAPDLVERIAAYVESESECLMPIVVEETKRAYGVRLLKVMADEIREKFNPQPDSSSISSEQTWIDLPTGSGYWWHHDGNPDLRPFIYHVQISFTGSPRYFIDFPDSRWCDEVGGKWMKVIQPKGWAAAKGSTDTEGR